MNNLTERTTNHISYLTYTLAVELLETHTPFTLILDNHNDWDNELPERLQKEQFVIDIKAQTLEDSFIKDGKIIVVMLVDDMEFIKQLEPCDISAVALGVGLPPIIQKPFRENPEFKLAPMKKQELPSVADMTKSMAAIRKHNPHLFGDKVE